MNRTCFWVAIVLCVALVACFQNHEPEETVDMVLPAPDTLVVDTDTLPRTSITFILGEDENARNPYYSLANQYYRLSDSEQTEVVVDTIFSLVGVRNYLERNCPTNGRPWGLINLVSHGNEFTDLSVTVTHYGDRASEETILQAIADSVFMPLDSIVVDKKTLIDLHGCAVGNNKGLLTALGIAFGRSKCPVRVKASKLFEYYAYLSQNKNPQSIRHYYARAWYGYFKADSIPPDEVLADQFRERYPRDTIDWVKAVRRQHQFNPGQPYHLTLRVPIIWEEFYEHKEDLPDLRTRKKQQKWLAEKTEIQDLMGRTHIPKEYFEARFYLLIYNSDSGTVYSNKVKARAGVVCVIQPMLSAEKSETVKYPPFIPAAEDTNYFGFSRF